MGSTERDIIEMESDGSPSAGLIISWTTSAILALFILYNLHYNSGPTNPLFPQIAWSPLQHLLEYDVKVFKSAFGGDIDRRYQGPPSPEIDANWDDLYNFGSTMLNTYEAAHLPNKTWPIVQEPGNYIAVIDVFHHLHCLNMIRKALHPEYYVPHDWSDAIQEDNLLGELHLDHCVDSIRQSLMCMSDVSVIPWQWDTSDSTSKPVGNIVHTCRNFDAIRSWVYDRRMIVDFDKYTDMRHDPLAGVFDWSNMGQPGI
ncbi:hypothetical protein CLAIMM_09819 [Cladophialophora immunda]|nr:hypothetical protein CLAIMM_09819 [Cladophialophora immunda]